MEQRAAGSECGWLSGRLSYVETPRPGALGSHRAAGMEWKQIAGMELHEFLAGPDQGAEPLGEEVGATPSRRASCKP